MRSFSFGLPTIGTHSPRSIETGSPVKHIYLLAEAGVGRHALAEVHAR